MNKYIVSVYLLIFVCTVSAQETGSVKGNIIAQETGKVIPNAEVIIKETSQGAVATEKGIFEIRNIKPGKYTFYAHALGYVTDTLLNKEIESGKISSISFSLKTKNIKLNEVTISATKIQKTIDKIGSPVYLMGRKDIERTEGRNIEEVLIRVPGVFTEDRYHGESNLVSFRGVGLHTHVTRGILVLVDGVSLTEAMGRTDFEGVDLENAEKVEVLKGPVSALYGPNGITGVINVVEKTPEEGFHGKFKSSYGSYNSMTFSGDVNGRKNGFGYLVKGKYFNTNGYMDRSGSTSSRVGLKLIQKLNESSKLQFTTDYIDSERELPGTLTREQFDERSTEASNKFAGTNRGLLRSNLVYTKDWNENVNLYANLYYRNNNSDGFYADNKWSDDLINSFGGEIRSQWNHTLFGKKNSIIFGISLLNEKGNTKTYNRDIETGEIGMKTEDGISLYNLLGVFAEDEFMLVDKLAITFGVRYDLVDYDWTDSLHQGEDNTSGKTKISSFSPKFGFAYNPTKKITVFGNIARGFNPPQIYQLFVGSSYAGLPNPELKPEYLSNFELGIRGDVHNKFNYQASFFRMNFTDQISAEIDEEIDPINPIYQNIGETIHSGLETALEYYFTNQFNMYVNYSYLNARFNDSPDYGDNSLRKTPKNTLNSGLRYDFKFGLSAALDYKFVDEFYMDNEEVNVYEGYSTLNLKFMYQRNGFMTTFAINNLTDTNYATYAYASKVYDRASRQMVWEQRYIPGWPINFNVSISIDFSFNKLFNDDFN